MPTMMSVNEAKANFSGMLSEVESGLVSFTIMRYGRPIARVVPIDEGWNGRRVNLGAYGNTPWSTMTAFPGGAVYLR